MITTVALAVVTTGSVNAFRVLATFVLPVFALVNVVAVVSIAGEAVVAEARIRTG